MSLLERIEKNRETEDRPESSGQQTKAQPVDSEKGSLLSSLQARRSASPGEKAQQDKYFDLKTRVQNRLYAEVDLDMDVAHVAEIRKTIQVIFDQALADLLIARDLLDYESKYVSPEEPLGAVLQKFHDIKEQSGHLPVVAEGEQRRVVGMIRQRDVVDMFRRIRSEPEKPGRSG